MPTNAGSFQGRVACHDKTLCGHLINDTCGTAIAEWGEEVFSITAAGIIGKK